MAAKPSTTKSFIWSFLEQGGSKAVSLIVQIVLARLLAPAAFGMLAIMLVVMEVANVVSQSGLGQALIQDQDADALSATTAFWLSIAIAVVLYVVIFLMAPLIAGFYGMPGLDGCLRVLALAVPVSAANSVQRSLLQKKMDFKSIFRANLVASCLAGAVGIAAAVAGWGVWALVVQAISQAVLQCVAMAVQLSWRPSFAFSVTRAQSMFAYGWKVMATGILNTVYTGVSELILGKAVPASDLGLYSQGRKWPAAGIGVVTNAVSNVLLPAFSQMQGDARKLAEALKRAVAAGTFAVAPLALFFCAAAEPLVCLLLGEQWLGCVTVFQLTCVPVSLVMLQLPNLRAYMALGDSGLYLRLQVVKVVLSCAAIWPTAFFTRDINATAAVTAACAVASVLVVDLRPARRMHGVGRVEQLRLAAPALIIAAVSALLCSLVLLVPVHEALALVLQTVVFACVFLISARTLDIPGYSDFIGMVRGALGKVGER